MRRRYTIHRDGDLLVEELDAQGRAKDPEPVPPEDRLPVEVVVFAEDTDDARAALLDLLELAFGMESEGPGVEKPPG
ncbi:MAG TPA: hypothetical protein VIG99_06385 [Myxococcaceae bacterium]